MARIAVTNFMFLQTEHLSFPSNDADSPEHEQTSQSGGTRAPCRSDVFTAAGGAAAQGSASMSFDEAVSLHVGHAVFLAFGNPPICKTHGLSWGRKFNFLKWNPAFSTPEFFLFLSFLLSLFLFYFQITVSGLDLTLTVWVI